ncbi:glycosyltransferase family 4 protein [Belnapia sp. F-4-1]|uniref:glycosyltransferase family 4 protein n=1 Tax=Belnapia sp. F-4-1 TaxID=1545443 RepID=UPI0009DF8A58|nr:glycosyltransferase family 4 protein [Belnapia sp. F-4-1]
MIKVYDLGQGPSGRPLRRLAQGLYRQLPQGLRQAGFRHLTALLAPRPTRRGGDGPRAPGLIIVGEFSLPTGLGQAARLMRDGARRRGLPVWTIDVSRVVPGGNDQAPSPQVCLDDYPPGVPLVLQVNPPTLPWTLLHLPRALLKGRRVIGSWVWELERAPASWRSAAPFVHEVWTPSRFVAGALADCVRCPVRRVPYPVADVETSPTAIDRDGFGLPRDRTIVFAAIGLHSSPARKNPEGVIQAFKAAAAGRDDMLLVLKVSGQNAFPADMATLQAAIAGDPAILIEDRVMPDSDMQALLRCSDVVLSMHRSEGFGLVPAEAMRAGIPVVATDWSATAEFIDASCGVPVPCRLIPVQDSRSVYTLPGARWADPDPAAAAQGLKRLVEDAQLRRQLGARGMEMVRQHLGADAMIQALAGDGATVPHHGA